MGSERKGIYVESQDEYGEWWTMGVDPYGADEREATEALIRDCDANGTHLDLVLMELDGQPIRFTVL